MALFPSAGSSDSLRFWRSSRSPGHAASAVIKVDYYFLTRLNIVTGLKWSPGRSFPTPGLEPGVCLSLWEFVEFVLAPLFCSLFSKVPTLLLTARLF